MTDNNPEGNAATDDPFALDQTVPGWQAAAIRLARPALLWALGVVTMGLGVVIVGAVEALSPGAGVRMTVAMGALLTAYPPELYYLVAFLFGGQALAGIIKSIKGG